MPELPEVETVVRSIRPALVGRRVTAMWYDWPPTIHQPSPQSFAARLQGQGFRAVRRRAKYIVCELDHDLLVIHLKMTGRLYVVNADSIESADKWVHFRVDLDNGQQLRFSDSRKFGRVYLVADFAEINDNIGPEPLEDDFTLDVFQERLKGRQKNIKALLLDQSFIAGVGNIYADEALFRARIHPLRGANTLYLPEVAALHEAIRAALDAGIQHEGASISWYRKPDGTKGSSQDHFYVYGRTAQPCTACGTFIHKIRVAQRGTHFCPQCQRLTD
ncbi:MAG: bifunctional DNA-formamidopyrimidine glycosylase/DNA-(apurinic or apyrimidinic site) lyase [Chloroflexi bacterium AL-W]|nr:bifunctional DNA-formamidopyrimidine glycosylase/DNA-(apurinic or apyrimidinic site) lyase [Chloroflexi bacterium AL-W]